MRIILLCIFLLSGNAFFAQPDSISKKIIGEWKLESCINKIEGGGKITKRVKRKRGLYYYGFAADSSFISIYSFHKNNCTSSGRWSINNKNQIICAFDSPSTIPCGDADPCCGKYDYSNSKTLKIITLDGTKFVTEEFLYYSSWPSISTYKKISKKSLPKHLRFNHP